MSTKDERSNSSSDDSSSDQFNVPQVHPNETVTEMRKRLKREKYRLRRQVQRKVKKAKKQQAEDIARKQRETENARRRKENQRKRDREKRSREDLRSQKLQKQRQAVETRRTQAKTVKETLKKQDYAREHEEHSREKEKDNIREEAQRKCEPSEFATSEQQDASIRKFEQRCKSIRHKCCEACQCVSLNLEVGEDGYCKECKHLGRTKDYWIKEELLPVWYCGDHAQLSIPEPLRGLTDAEKALIQIYNVFLPVHHLRHGTMGLKGHCCAFPQALDEVCMTLPRAKDDAGLVKLLKTYEKDVGILAVKSFRVRKSKVLAALRYLKQHSTEYANICIDPTRLDWIGEDTDEGILEPVLEHTSFVEKAEDCIDNDLGPSPKVSVDPRNADGVEDTVAYGVLAEDAPILPSAEDKDIANQVQAAIKQSGVRNTDTLKWPSISDTAVSEYDKSIKIFAGAFPWLFPGGRGDFVGFRQHKITPADWAKKMLTYKDGRFATDKMFGFFVNNYVVRRRNQSSGNFFVKTFCTDAPPDIDSLKEAITAGNTRFVNEISYFAKSIQGSDSYWRIKKSELYTWISHHVEMGNGCPHYFMTLSCAEYWWPDIMRLVNERIWYATGKHGYLEDNPNCRVQVLNDWSVVVQEYFQLRVIAWIETVGKEVFGIKHYWIRYEFAASRGQIHAHFLAIANDKAIQLQMYHHRGDEEQQAKILSEWAAKKFGLTAQYSEHAETEANQEFSPCAKYYCDIKEDDREGDIESLKRTVGLHTCSGYCLRQCTKDEKREWCRQNKQDPENPPKPFKLRICRFGAGIEKTEGRGDTPGVELTDTPYFETARSGFRKLRMPRNDKHVNQVSAVMLQSWRANCDVQILIYDSHPDRPNLDEIARVTDYVVGYNCKGAKTAKEEKDQIIGIIKKFSEESADGKSDVTRLARKLMNKAASARIISKQESEVLNLGLDLVKCSDRFDNISIVGKTFISKDRSGNSGGLWRKKYDNRTSSDEIALSLHRFYHKRKNQKPGDNRRTWYIPHYTGSGTQPVFPPTRSYARAVFLIHKPWKGNFVFPDADWHRQFDAFVNSKHCPKAVQAGLSRALYRFVENTEHAEATATEPEVNICNDEEVEEFLALTARNGSNADNDGEDLKFECGENDFDWTQQGKNIKRDACGDGASWLMEQVRSDIEKEDPNDLDLAMKIDDKGVLHHYELEDLHHDQQEVAVYILDHIRKWIEHDPTRDGPFQGITLTVRGKGGSGKTVLLRTITSVVRRMFQSRTAVHVAGPTGASACNAGGSTFHHLFGIYPDNHKSMSVTEHTRNTLRDLFMDTVVLQLDERSMVSSISLARIECVSRHTVHGGFRLQEPWGGIPVIIMYGDDHQLPSIWPGVNSIPLPGYSADDAPPIPTSKVVIRGNCIFLDFAEDVMDLPVIKRQDASEDNLRAQLDRTRHDELTVEDVKYFRQRHIDSDELKQYRKNIIDKSLMVFAFVDRKNQWNTRSLHTLHSKKNPVAKIRAQYEGHGRLHKAVKKHFSKDDTPERVLICIDAWVHLAGKNIRPKWGLYNGARGKVVEIHFKNKGDNPNSGCLPDYVVVDMTAYNGPIWDKKNPTHVPIPVAQHRCSFGCCIKKFIPLELSFATTIHKIQGLTAGPTKEGQIPNAVESMVFDIGPRRFESSTPGLFYVVHSRGTTLGDDNPKDSAIFFCGENVTDDRLINMTRRKTKSGEPGEKNLRAKRRDAWVNLLKRNTHDSGLSLQAKKELFNWVHQVIDKKKYSKIWVIKRTEKDSYCSDIP